MLPDRFGFVHPSLQWKAPFVLGVGRAVAQCSVGHQISVAQVDVDICMAVAMRIGQAPLNLAVGARPNLSPEHNLQAEKGV